MNSINISAFYDQVIFQYITVYMYLKRGRSHLQNTI